MTALNVKVHRITPTAGGIVRVPGNVSAVVCDFGAFAGARIHFEQPTTSEKQDVGEALIDGNAYLPRDGTTDAGFWVSFPSMLPVAAATLRLRSFVGCIETVIALNARPRPGWLIHQVGGATPGLLEVVTGEVTLYEDPLDLAANVGYSGLDELIPSGRGYIGGAWVGTAIAASAVTVTLWQRVTADAAFWAELARFELTAQDRSGANYSCCFENGGGSYFRSVSTAVKNGPTLIPWPAFGLKLTVQAITNDFTDTRWSLYERFSA